MLKRKPDNDKPKQLADDPAYLAAVAKQAELQAELDRLTAREQALRAAEATPGGNVVDRLLVDRVPDSRRLTELAEVTTRTLRIREAIRLQALEAESAARLAAASICAAGLPELAAIVREQLVCLRRLTVLAADHRALVRRYATATGGRTTVLEQWESLAEGHLSDRDCPFWVRVAAAEDLGLVEPGEFGKRPGVAESQDFERLARYVSRGPRLAPANAPRTA